ncbi:MAG TPA: alkaline phosphatase family protein [Kofleriaceae bacterium]|nr:alkaline phosphatase family protein [Kofleriaceae bacterium]
MARPERTSWAIVAAVVLLAVGTGGAIKAALVGADYMYDLEQPHPALASVTPILAVDPPPRRARRVVVVIIDGLRLDASYGLPYLDELRRAGVDSRATTHYPTYSRPNYVTILTGVPPIASGVRTNLYSSTVALDSIMDRAHEAKLTSAYASDYDALPRLFLRDVSTRHSEEDDEEEDTHEEERERTPTAEAARKRIESPMVGAFDDARYSPWPGGFVSAARGVIAANDDLVVMLIGVVDAAGHRYGGASDEYREAAASADRALRRALAGLDLEQDAVIVVADHGHTDRGGHGGLEPDVLEVPLIIAGAGVKVGADPKDARLIDVAPTAAALLGVPPPGHGVGRTLTEALAFEGPDLARIEAADVTRIARNDAIVDASINTWRADVLEARAWRLALVIVLAAIAIASAWYLRKLGGLRLDWHVLTVGVPAFFIVYYTAIGVLGQRFSPSAIPARGHISAELAKYGAAGALVHLLAGLRALRGRKTLAERLAAANGIAWTGLLLAMVAAGVMWAFFPPPYVEVPGPKTLVLIPAVEIAVACYAGGVALTLVVEVIVFFARLWHHGAPVPKS